MFSIIDFIRAHAVARWSTTERGASLVEYALLLALIAVVCIAAVTAMGGSLSSNYDDSQTSLFGS